MGSDSSDCSSSTRSRPRLRAPPCHCPPLTPSFWLLIQLPYDFPTIHGWTKRFSEQTDAAENQLITGIKNTGYIRFAVSSHDFTTLDPTTARLAPLLSAFDALSLSLLHFLARKAERKKDKARDTSCTAQLIVNQDSSLYPWALWCPCGPHSLP